MNQNSYLQSFKIIILALFLALGTSYIFASGTWTAPTSTPPDGNTDAPINVGNSGQVKIGGLTLNTGGATNGLLVPSGKVGIGTSTPASTLDIISGASDTSILGVGASSSNKIFQVKADGNVCINANGGCVKAWGAEPRTSDPTSPVSGQMWLRTDLP